MGERGAHLRLGGVVSSRRAVAADRDQPHPRHEGRDDRAGERAASRAKCVPPHEHHERDQEPRDREQELVRRLQHAVTGATAMVTMGTRTKHISQEYSAPINPGLTCDHLVTYTRLHDGRRRPGVQGARRSDATAPGRPAARARRPHAHGARVQAGDDQVRRHEAPPRPRESGARGDPEGRAGEAAFPQRRPDPAHSRPMDRQVHRAPRVGAHGSQATTGGGLGMSTTATETSTSTQVYRIFIRATPQKIWDAITDPEWTQRFGYGLRDEYELRPGGKYRGRANAGMLAMGMPDVTVDGEVIESDPPRKLVVTWRMAMDPTLNAEGFTRLTYEIVEGKGGVSRLSVIHDLAGRPGHAAMVAGVLQGPGEGGGWLWILSDLKSLLENGAQMTTERPWG